MQVTTAPIIMADHYPQDKGIDNGVDAPVESHHPREKTAGEYAATRISSLKPPMNKAPNPFKLLALLSGKQWLFFLVGFLAWVNLFFDYQALSLILCM